jgi:DNA-binding NarL/FixJ family response regulator
VAGHERLGYRGKSLEGHILSDRISERTVAVRLNMNAPKKPPTYSPEQSKVLTDRLFALRANWLNHVETELARQQKRKSAEQAPLTDREQQIAFLIGRGYTSRGIALRLALSEGTVKVHTHHIFQKLGVKTRLELIYALSRH